MPVEFLTDDAGRAGCALQLVKVRWLETLLEDPLDVPGEVLDFVAGQLAADRNPRCRGPATPLGLYRESGQCYGAERGREQIASGLRATAGQQGWPPWRLAQAIRQQAGTPTLLMA
jgi:hypothetical protein